jgi:hypothetical protein
MITVRTAQVGTPISFWFEDQTHVGRVMAVNATSLSVDMILCGKVCRAIVGPDQYEGILSFTEAQAECPALFPADLTTLRAGTPVRFNHQGHETLGRLIRVNKRSITVDATIDDQPIRAKVALEDIHALLEMDEAAQEDPAMFAPNVLGIPAPITH